MTKLDTWPWSDDESEPPPDECHLHATIYSAIDPDHFPTITYFMTKLHTFTRCPSPASVADALYLMNLFENAPSPRARPSEEPHALPEEPDAPSEEPHALSEEPDAPSEEPHALSEEPDAPSEEPHALSEEPDAPSEEPHASSDEPDAPSDEPDAPSDEPDLEISNWWPYRRSRKLIRAMIALILSALWILRNLSLKNKIFFQNRPNKEAVLRAQLRLAEIKADTSLTPPDYEICRAVIDLNEMHDEYWDTLTDMVEKLVKICVGEGKLDEEVVRKWNEAELGEVMERVELCGRKLRIFPHALRRLFNFNPPHLQVKEINQDQAYDPEMKLDLPYLPSDMVHEILCRLPLNHIAIYKCVCKPWLDVFECESFVESHLSNYAPVLVVSTPDGNSNWFNVFKLEDEDKDDDEYEYEDEDEDEYEYEHEHDPERKSITKFDFPQVSTIQGSANGLLLLKNHFIDYFYVCNPFTREFIELRGPHTCSEYDFYGIGVGKKRGKHKVVHISPEFGCHVYTLETRSSWRRIETTLPFPSYDGSNRAGAFVNGNIHWLVVQNCWAWSMTSDYICCFDVEEECFSIFFPPGTEFCKGLYTLGDCLCFHDFETLGCDHVIWLLKKYEQVKKYDADLFEPHNSILLREAKAEANKFRSHWSEVHVILRWERSFNHFQPIKIYTNGDMLILWNANLFKCYRKRQRTIRTISSFGGLHGDGFHINSILLTPNFLSLKRNFGLENVMAL